VSKRQENVGLSVINFTALGIMLSLLILFDFIYTVYIGAIAIMHNTVTERINRL